VNPVEFYRRVCYFAFGCNHELPPNILMEEQLIPPPEPSSQPEQAPPTNSGGDLISELKSWFRDIIVIFLIQPVKVEGTSMQPRLVDQERIFVNRFIYRFEDIHRGDIVVFWYPRDTNKSFIKRVVAIPGDQVEIFSGDVFVNGTKIEEPYLKAEFRDHDSFHKTIVPRDQYFVLGDHRNSSNDSRNWGFVPRSLIYGKAIFSYWPVSRVGMVE
jgi:signal peptidase I